jgi:hypothetical protein
MILMTAEHPIPYFTIASAHSQVEAIRIQMLLDRARLPYRMRGDKLYALYGDMIASALAGPMQFLIPVELKALAEECLMDIFTVDPQNLPNQCPACDTPVPSGTCDCLGCGLFLG